MTSARHHGSSGVRDEPYLGSYRDYDQCLTIVPLTFIMQYPYLASVYEIQSNIIHPTPQTPSTEKKKEKTNKTQNTEDQVQAISLAHGPQIPS